MCNVLMRAEPDRSGLRKGARLRLPSVVLAIVLLTSCAWFPKRDPEQPLVPRGHAFPPETALASAEATFGTAPGKVKDSLRDTHRALTGWSITGYADFSAYLNISSLVDAVEEWDQNAYAYFLLAPYLAVNYRPHAALEASHRAQTLLAAQLPDANLRELYPDELPALNELNRARYLVRIGANSDAESAINQLNARPTLNPLIRLAGAWIQVDALIGLYDLRGAEQMLVSSRAIEIPEDIASQWEFDYSPYVKHRDAYDAYYEGLLRFAAGDYAAARTSFTQALKKSRGLYEAQFTLALTEARVGEPDAAITRLKQLGSRLPGAPTCGFLRRGNFRGQERISFNLALLEEKAGQLVNAEQDYQQAIKVAKCTAEGFNEDIDRNILKRSCASSTHPADFCRMIAQARSEKSGSFPEAQNNLGQMLLRRLEQEKHLSALERHHLLEGATESLHAAAFDREYTTPELAIRGLTRLYRRNDDLATAQILELAERAIRIEADDADLATLVTQVTLSTANPNERARGFAILAAIAVNLPSSVDGLQNDPTWKSRLDELRGDHPANDADESLAILLYATEGPSNPELQGILANNAAQPWAKVRGDLSRLESGRKAESSLALTTADEVSAQVAQRPRAQWTLGDVATARLADRLRLVAKQNQN